MKNEYIRVPYGSTVHGPDEIEAVVKVLNTSTQMGLKTKEFESEAVGDAKKEFSKEEMKDYPDKFPNHYKKLEELGWEYGKDFPMPEGIAHTREPFEQYMKYQKLFEEKHYGIDIATNELEKIYSILDGAVLISGKNLDFGNFLIISHPENLMSIYMHASSFTKISGDSVHSGDLVGFTGNTGALSNGTHLHFELRHNGGPINPEKYIVF